MTDVQIVSPFTNRRPLLLIVVTMIFLLLALVASWALFLPQRLANKLISDVQRKSGLVLAVDGGSHLQWGNGINVVLSDVSASSLKQQETPLMTADRIVLPLNFASLFGITDAPRQLVVENANVSVDLAAGKNLGLDVDDKSDAGGVIKDQRPFEIILVNGTLKLLDVNHDFALSMTDLDGSIVRQADTGLNLKLRGLLNGKSTSLDVGIDDGWRVLDEGGPAEMTLATAEHQLAFSGRLKAKEGLQLDGRLQGHGAGLQPFAAWLGIAITTAPIDGVLNFDGGLSVTGTLAKLNDLTLSLGDMHAAGKIALMAQGSRPRLEAVLDFDTLDFRTGKKSTVTSAYSAKTWSEEAITFSDLGAIDADIQLSAKVLKRGELQAGAAKLSAKLIAKKLDANMTSPDVAGGKLSTTLVLDATSAVPKFDWKMQAEAVNAQILLKELFGFEALQGPVKFDADLQSAGVSQAEIISNLHGTANLALTDGKLIGLGLATLLNGSHKGWQLSDQMFTVLAVVDIAANVEDGIAELARAKIVGGGVAVEAKGQVDLLRQDIEVVAKPLLEGSGIDLKLPVFVKISGAWQEPDISPGVDDKSLKPALRLLNQAVDSDGVEKIGKKAKKTFKKLFGN